MTISAFLFVRLVDFSLSVEMADDNIVSDENTKPDVQEPVINDEESNKPENSDKEVAISSISEKTLEGSDIPKTADTNEELVYTIAIMCISILIMTVMFVYKIANRKSSSKDLKQ